MGISVIGTGFGRTGTLSIKRALEILGLGPCHHMEEVFTNPAQLPHWQAAMSGQVMDWDATLSGFQSTIDWPSTHFWRQLIEFYPDARVLLTYRPPEVWWNSFSSTIKKLLEIRDTVPDEYIRSVLKMAYEMIAERDFGGMMDDKQHVLAMYQKRIDEVRASVAPERLLEFDVTQGWAPLCEFLQRPVPEEEFPNINSKDEFWQTFGGAQDSA